jgi:hypothetical protein
MKIKFRIWNVEEKKYELFDLETLFQTKYSGCFKHHVGVPTNISLDSENLVFQQSTYLLDKNKKEIYEGDIIRYESGGTARNAEVWWDEEFAMFCFDRDYEFTFMDKIQNIEIIGNIFETPDLIK